MNELDEVKVSEAIVRSYTNAFLDALELDVAVVGAGPSGMTAAYYAAKNGAKVAIFERGLSVGGGMPGGGMMFSRVVFERDAREILDELEIRVEEFGEYLVADALEAVAMLCVKCLKAGVRIFNLLSVEDVVFREKGVSGGGGSSGNGECDFEICGVVLNWTAVERARLHVDPLVARSKVVIDATGHDAEICRIVERKLGAKLQTATGKVIGERSMWAEKGENELLENTKEVFPGLIVAGMAANAVAGSPRMGAVFGGMLLSGKKAAEIAIKIVREKER